MTPVAEVYHANVEYPRDWMWRTPSRIVGSTEDVERGVHWRPCPECNGTGIFDLPDTATRPPLTCNRCKGSGLDPVTVA